MQQLLSTISSANLQIYYSMWRGTFVEGCWMEMNPESIRELIRNKGVDVNFNVVEGR